MNRTVDYSFEDDLDKVGSIAIDMSLRIREEDPRRLFDEFTNLCQWHPVKAAQLLQCFAAFTDPDTDTKTLFRRVAGISEDRTTRRTGVAVLEPVDWADCGTERQAARHRRRGEKPCAACRDAEARARSARGYQKKVSA